jgi:hypothetical protein
MSSRSSRKTKWRARLHAAQDGRCFYCSVATTMEFKSAGRPYDHTLTLDHVYPRTDPRRNDPDAEANRMGIRVVGACYRCNNERNDTPFEIFCAMKRERVDA